MQEYTIETLNYGRKVYDFMRWDYAAFGISLILLVAASTILLIRGFSWGLDFTGGTVIEMSFKQPVNIDYIRNHLKEASVKDFIIQNFGSRRDVMIRMSSSTEIGAVDQELVKKAINAINASKDNPGIVNRIEFVGPNAGCELVQDGCLALLVALISILIYVSFRFEWHLACGAVIALLHDVIITLGVLSLFNVEIDLTIIASLMSIIGYSLNDSIVVFDRIRENFRKICRGTSYEIMNVSLTQSLNRTLMTSGIIVLVVLILHIFGGEMLHSFSITMLVGISIGTLSSIYVASALALKMGMKREDILQKNAENEEL